MKNHLIQAVLAVQTHSAGKSSKDWEGKCTLRSAPLLLFECAAPHIFLLLRKKTQTTLWIDSERFLLIWTLQILSPWSHRYLERWTFLSINSFLYLVLLSTFHICHEIFLDYQLIYFEILIWTSPSSHQRNLSLKFLCLTCWGWMSISEFSKLAFVNRWTTTDKQIRPVAAPRKMLNTNDGEQWRANLIESGHYCRQWTYLAQQHPIKTGPFCVSSDS